MIKLNGFEFNSRQLSIKDISYDSITLYERESMHQESAKHGCSPISRNKKHTGDPRPASNASSRQEESVSSTNRVEDEFEGINLERAGGERTTAQHNKSMTQVLREKQNRQQLEARKRCQLLIDIQRDDEGAPYPSAQMVYWVLTEQLGLSNDPFNGAKAIYTPNPTNHWRWSVLFNSENLKSKFEGRATTFIQNNDNTEYTP